MDWPGTWGVAMGAAWLSGFKLYASILTLGLLQRFGFANLPGDLHVLGEWWVLSLAGLLFLVEFVADKIPAVDSVWDAVHTFIRVPAGGIRAFGQPCSTRGIPAWGWNRFDGTRDEGSDQACCEYVSGALQQHSTERDGGCR